MEWNSISYVIQYTTGKLNFCHPFKCIDRGIYKILLYNLCTSKRYTDQIYIVICEGKEKKNKQTKHTSSRQSKAKKKPFQKWTTLNRWWILSQCLHRENKGASKKWKYRVTASVSGLWLVHKLKSCTLARTIYYSTLLYFPLLCRLPHAGAMYASRFSFKTCKFSNIRRPHFLLQ